MARFRVFRPGSSCCWVVELPKCALSRTLVDASERRLVRAPSLDRADDDAMFTNADTLIESSHIQMILKESE